MIKFPQYLYALDLIRVIAAYVVVLSHWNVLFWDPLTGSNTDLSILPFAPYLYPFYHSGSKAVDLFFLLSGFVFFWLYRQRISSKDISISEFARVRFARLYPLHLATLLIVGAGQWALVKNWGFSYLQTKNDLPHFALNVFFASSWGLEVGPSFNTPIWSVSVEVLIYTVFFGLCKAKLANGWGCLGMILFGVALPYVGLLHVGRGMVAFFLGGLVFYGVSWASCKNVRTVWVLIAGLTIAAGSMTNWLWNSFYELWASLGMRQLLSHDYVGAALLIFREHSLVWLVFPGLICVVALFEIKSGRLGKKFAKIEDFTYEIYLLHFPLMLLMWSLVHAFGLGPEVFTRSWVLVGFMAGLTGCSWLVFVCFERPLRDRIRGRRSQSPPTERPTVCVFR
jgi:peptidoglycan/LPS O-acetylase OafA/YrhL